ncbi:MAG: hypothetical protein OXG27_09230 [Chloroflexi bacterium]|nr:hypothetical protein [Chloroflexota bacterium]
MSTSTKPPIPESQWVEFASREWCEEANRYLQEQAALHPDALDGVEWSVTERWQNAPPHLGFQDNVAGFWFAISGGNIEVGAGPAAEADTEIDGDYNAILPIGWTIYNGDAEIRARAQREYGHLSRDKPVKMKGQFPSHPPLLPFLGGLHDHMARRTINNPDIDHRIEHYGLASKARELNEQGLTVLEGAFTAEMLDELRDIGGASRHWEEMVVHPWVATLVDQELGLGSVVVRQERESPREGTLTAIWTLADEAMPYVEARSVAVSVGAAIDAETDGTLRVVYAAAGSELAKFRVEIGSDAALRNPPVFLSRCRSNS